MHPCICTSWQLAGACTTHQHFETTILSTCPQHALAVADRQGLVQAGRAWCTRCCTGHSRCMLGTGAASCAPGPACLLPCPLPVLHIHAHALQACMGLCARVSSCAACECTMQPSHHPAHTTQRCPAAAQLAVGDVVPVAGAGVAGGRGGAAAPALARVTGLERVQGTGVYMPHTLTGGRAGGRAGPAGLCIPGQRLPLRAPHSPSCLHSTVAVHAHSLCATAGACVAPMPVGRAALPRCVACPWPRPPVLSHPSTCPKSSSSLLLLFTLRPLLLPLFRPLQAPLWWTEWWPAS